MENGVVNLSNRLDPERFTTTIVCLEQPGAFVERLSGGIEVRSLGKPPGFTWSVVLALRDLLRSLKPDLIHSHNLGPLIYAALARDVGAWSVPIVHGEHGVLSGENARFRRRLQRWLLYGRCASVVTVSESLKEHLISMRLGGAGKIVAIPNGVDCRKFSPEVDRLRCRSQLSIPPEAFVIGCVGRFIPSKRHDLLLRAFFAHCERKVSARPIRLIFAGGGGSEEGKVKRIIEDHAFGDRVIWLGHREDLERIYPVLDLHVMPSSVEGLSNAMLESMACGVPTLAHPACGASEVIEDGADGFLRTMETAEELTENLGLLLNSPDSVLRAGVKARKKVLSRFSVDAMVAGYDKLFEVVCGREVRGQV